MLELPVLLPVVGLKIKVQMSKKLSLSYLTELLKY